MIYSLSYRMLVGTGTRMTSTATEAVRAYRQIQAAGGADIEIIGPGGPMTFSELKGAALLEGTPSIRGD